MTETIDLKEKQNDVEEYLHYARRHARNARYDSFDRSRSTLRAVEHAHYVIRISRRFGVCPEGEDLLKIAEEFIALVDDMHRQHAIEPHIWGNVEIETRMLKIERDILNGTLPEQPRDEIGHSVLGPYERLPKSSYKRLVPIPKPRSFSERVQHIGERVYNALTPAP